MQPLQLPDFPPRRTAIAAFPANRVRVAPSPAVDDLIDAAAFAPHDLGVVTPIIDIGRRGRVAVSLPRWNGSLTPDQARRAAHALFATQPFVGACDLARRLWAAADDADRFGPAAAAPLSPPRAAARALARAALAAALCAAFLIGLLA